ncbi:hypothetical protein RND71_042827 [Anisodus tanguticus]|uniref:HMA domain-containing protein n=1 Tax=Anisodus tanguticus TaxID=243964 RepID=A0AAE1QRN2_9SOLA|nr:hypothetical protein RND71_042827 [Anisodus tanguticus]
MDYLHSEVKSIPEAQLNYPSFSVRLTSTPQTYTRTVTNVGDATSSYKVEIVSPRGVVVKVKPSELNFSLLNQKLTYQVAFSKTTNNDVVQGFLKWTSNKHSNGVVLPELLTDNTRRQFIVDMSCQGCVNAVKSKLQTVEGVKNVDVDLDNQVVRILGSSSISLYLLLLPNSKDQIFLVLFAWLKVNMELTRIEANFSGLSPGKHAWSINEFGDLTRGVASTGKLYSAPLGDLGTLDVDEKGEAFYSGPKEKLRVADLIGRAIAVYATEDKSDPGLKAAVIARSAGVGENYKKLCTCDGTTI